MKKKFFKPVLFSLLCIAGAEGLQAQAQTAYTYVRQNESVVEADGCAAFDVSDKDAEMSFDASGNAIMKIDGVVVAKLTKDEVNNNNGELCSGFTNTSGLSTTGGISKAVTSARYATFYSPFQLEVPGDVAAYTGAVEGTPGSYVLATTEVTDVVPAGTAILLSAVEGSYDFSFSAATPAEIQTNEFQGTALAISNPSETGKTLCTLGHSAETGLVGFYNYSGSGIKAGTAYLMVSSSDAARGNVFVSLGGNATGIEGLSGLNGLNSLSGSSSLNGSNGKFLENGRLVIMQNGSKYNVNGQEVK